MAVDEDILFHSKRIRWGDKFGDVYQDFIKLMDDISSDAAELADQDEKIGCKLEGNDVKFPPGIEELLKRAADSGLMGMTYDGTVSGEECLNAPIILPIIWYDVLAAKHTGLLAQVLTDGVIEVLENLAPKDLQEKYIPSMMSGKAIGGMAMTESDAGSDLGRIITKAEEITEGEDKGLYSISGEKIFITNPHSEVLIVLARDADNFGKTKGTIEGLSMFLVPKYLDEERENRNDIKIDRLEEKLGIHSSPTGTLVFDGAKGYLLGKKGEGMKQFFRLMNYERLAVAAQALGLSQGAFDYALDFADNDETGREQGGRKISKWPAVSNMLVEMKTDIEAVRSLVYEAAQAMDTAKTLELRLKDKPKDEQLKGDLKAQRWKTNVLVWMAKYYAPKLGQDVTSNAVQVLGGHGYTKDHPVERHFRDMKITDIYEGTGQIQATQVATYVLQGRFDKEFDSMRTYFTGREDETSQYLSERLALFEEALVPLRFKRSDFLNKKKALEKRLPHVERITTGLAQLYSAYLLMQQSEDSERKGLVTDLFVSSQLKNETQQILDEVNSNIGTYFKNLVYNRELTNFR